MWKPFCLHLFTPGKAVVTIFLSDVDWKIQRKGWYFLKFSGGGGGLKRGALSFSGRLNLSHTSPNSLGFQLYLYFDMLMWKLNNLSLRKCFWWWTKYLPKSKRQQWKQGNYILFLFKDGAFAIWCRYQK